MFPCRWQSPHVKRKKDRAESVTVAERQQAQYRRASLLFVGIPFEGEMNITGPSSQNGRAFPSEMLREQRNPSYNGQLCNVKMTGNTLRLPTMRMYGKNGNLYKTEKVKPNYPCSGAICVIPQKRFLFLSYALWFRVLLAGIPSVGRL